MILSSNVIQAKFREADPQRDKAAYPNKNPLWRWTVTIIQLPVRALCTVRLFLEKTNILKWTKPLPFELIDRVSGWLKIAPECNFISYFPTFFFGTFYHIRDPLVIKAFFKEFRGSSDSNSLFTPTRSVKTLYNIITEVFPNDGITEEDVIFTCSQENSKYYRKWLHRLFDLNHIQSYRSMICEEAKKTLQDWSGRSFLGKSIPLFESALYASRIMTNLMFGEKVNGQALANAVAFINWYTLHKQIGKTSQEDERHYKDTLNTFKEIVEGVIHENDIPFFADPESHFLSPQQKKAMAFILFFAGQETAGFLLGSILLTLAQNNDLQSSLRAQIHEKGRDHVDVRKEIDLLVNESLAKLPPSYAVSRRIASDKDICLEYQLEGENEVRKLIINRGELLSARMIDAAERIRTTLPKSINEERSYNMWSAFGGGAHSCPGKNLALNEVVEFVLTALENYKLETNIHHEPNVIGQITLKFTDDIMLKVTKMS